MGARRAKVDREGRIAYWTRRVQPRIQFCANCQPWDGGQPEWVLGDRIAMLELLGDLAVPEDIREGVAEKLICPFCGTELAWDHDVGVMSLEEREARRSFRDALRVWRTKYSKRFVSLHQHLSAYPYLGHSHPLGRRLLRIVPTLPTTPLLTSDWWRARPVCDAKSPSRKFMGPPPVGLARAEGRFTHYGQTAFYLASDPRGAAFEVLGRRERLAWIQRYEVRPRFVVLDLTGGDGLEDSPPSDDASLFAYGLVTEVIDRKHPSRSSAWKPEYFIPRYIADCARLSGLHGITFRGRKNAGVNLVVFSWEQGDIEPVGMPYLMDLEDTRPTTDPATEF